MSQAQDTQVSAEDVKIDTPAPDTPAADQANEELIHKAEDAQLKDPNEPKVRGSLPLLGVIGWDLIIIGIGMFWAAGSGIIPLVFFWVMGNSFGSMATASAAEIGVVTAQMGLNVTYIAIAAGFAAFFASFFFGIGSQRVSNRIRQQFFNQLTRQEIGYFDIKKAGALAHTLSDDAAKASDVYATHLQTITQNLTQVVVGLIMALVSNWTMALLQLSGIPLMMIVQMPMRPILAKLATKISEITGQSVSTANEVIGSMRTVRSMAGEEKEVQRYCKQLDRVSFLGFLTAITRGTSIMLLFFFIWGAVALAFWYGGVMLGDGRIDIGSFIKVYGLSLMTVIGLLFTLILIPEVIKAQASAVQLLKVIKRQPMMNFRGGKTLPEIRGHIQFQNVTFRYPSRPKVAVLKDFSLDIQPGTSVALVGQSGSGKSTIVGLIEKWYEPESGLILLDGEDITKLDPLWLHRHLGIVQQEPTLFATTIRRNIAYAVDTINGHIITAAKKENPKITEEELEALQRPVTQELIEKAAMAANAHDFIMKLPDAYDTVIGERGVSLSGGQKQRIAIARAVLQDPKMLLLDEATSALDTKSEALVQDALDKLMVGRTSIVIAHRLTTIQDCDNIVVMRQGVVVEMGKHDQMILNPEGAYYHLAAKQMKLGKHSGSSSNLSSEDTASSTDEESTGAETPAEAKNETDINTEGALSVVNASSALLASQQPSVEEQVNSKPLETNTKEKKKGRKQKKKKGVADFTNEEDVKDVHEPKVRNPFLVLKLCGIEAFFLLIGTTGAFLSGTAPIFNYLFFGNVVTAATPARNSDGAFIPREPGFSIAAAVATQASYIAIIAGGAAVAQFFNWLFTTMVYYRLDMRVKRMYFTAITRQEMGFFDIKKSGKLLSTLGEDIVSLSDGFTMKGALFAQHMGQFLIGIILALIASWQTALVMLAGGVPSIGAIIFFSAMAINYFNKKIMHLSASALASANEVIGAIRTVRSMAGEEREQRRYGNDLKKIMWAGFGKALATAIMMGGMQFCIWSVAALAFWYGGTLIANGTLASGALLQVFGNMLFAVLGASMALSEVQNFFKSMTAAFEVLRVIQRKPTIPWKGGDRPAKIEGNLDFKDITFEYPSRPGVIVMKGFNLSITKGQHVALVGESGCGKSTITGLIERFYEPKEGNVFLDGKNLREIDVEWLHKNVAIVTQEPVLFATTIRKNITYAVGDENVTMERIIECAKAANCHDFITNLPNGYDTVVGERGVSMSGGQKQRIAIARAMIQDASLLLLDEATSALDTEAEALVQAALDRLMVGKTTIVIAHRLSTVRDCDVIVAMRAGEVIEKGTHDELIQKKGMYFKLAQKQMEFGQDKGQGAAKTHVVITEDD